MRREVHGRAFDMRDAATYLEEVKIGDTIRCSARTCPLTAAVAADLCGWADERVEPV